jgi:hypothetical protein
MIFWRDAVNDLDTPFELEDETSLFLRAQPWIYAAIWALILLTVPQHYAKNLEQGTGVENTTYQP